MKINNLKLKNIHSLRGVHEVNFASGPLAQTGLFAITGPTGSGKSTLLDSITLALYNCTPRSGGLSKNAIEKTGAIISRNTDDAFCEVEYESGGQIYLSRWEISRARTGNLRDYHMTISVKNPAGEFELLDLKKSDVPDKNTEIIGLNYDQFIRSILLSQGEFAKFIKSKPEERSALLEKITGTGIYREIGQMAFEKQKSEKLKLDQLRDRLGDIILLGEDALKSLREEIGLFKKNIAETREKIRITQEKISVKQELKHKTEWIGRLKEDIEKLHRQQEAMREDLARLDQHNALMPLKSDIDRLSWLTGQATVLEKKQKQEQKNHTELRSGIENLSQEINGETKKLKSARHVYDELQPVISQVKKLDGELGTKRTGKNHLEKQLKRIGGEMTQAEQSIGETRKVLDAANKKLLKIDEFFKQNPGLENLAGVLSNVEGRKEMLDRKTTALAQKLKKEAPALAPETEKLPGFQQRLEVIQSKADAVSSEKETLISGFGDEIPDRQQIQEKLESAAIKMQILGDILRIVKQLEKNIPELAKFKRQLEALKPKIETLEQSRQMTDQAIQISEKRLEELQARRERESLEASYGEARRKLAPGEPCPLCGSKQHPFVDAYESHLEETDRTLQDQKDRLSVLRKEREAASEEVTRLESTGESLSGNIKRLEKEIAALQDDIRKPAGKLGLETQSITAELIKEKQNKSSEKQQLLKKQLALLDRIDAVEKKMNAFGILIQTVQEIVEIENGIHRALAPFEKYISEADGTENAIEILKIKQWHYEEGMKQSNEFREKKIKLTTALDERLVQFDELASEKKAVEKELLRAQTEVNLLAEEREALFGAKDSDEEDKAAAANIRRLEKNLATLNSKLDVTKEKAATAEERLKQMQKEAEDMSREKNHLQTKLLPKIKALGITSVEAALEKMLDDEEATAIRQKAEGLKSGLDKAGQSLADARQQAEELKKKDDPEVGLAELEKTAEELDKLVSESNREIGDREARIRHDQQNREKFAGLSGEIKKQEKEFSRWEALNKLIGDREGKRFARFAQQLTLMQMLAGANRHLKKLTDRYLIINESSSGDDQLFVIDTYHGDEKRSVKTLSGGESFLVSLALALGLSDLAGNKTKINSLFIDEGFGSLDQQTLDIALSTLERLQHETSRTIGVISHVEALKERITTQIELSQDASGKSSLTVRV